MRFRWGHGYDSRISHKIDIYWAGYLDKQIEIRKLNIHTLNLTDRIKRLEEAGNNLLWNFCPEYTSDLTQEQSDALKQWNKAKEAKP